MLNIDNIEKEYPKAFKDFLNWYEKGVKETFGAGKIDQFSISTAAVKSLIPLNIRILYTYFDYKEVILSICRDSNEKFYFFINDDDYTKTFENRVLAEEAGFEECFRILENTQN